MSATRSKRLPLRLGVKRRLSRRNDPREREARAAFEKTRLGIIDEDNSTCRGCGFASQRMDGDGAPAGGMEVHHLDDDHHNNKPSNLITLCPFCHMVFTLGRRGARFDATLGYEPRMSQAEINLLHHTVWGLSRALEIAHQDSSPPRGWEPAAVKGPMASALEQAAEALRQFREDAERRLRTQRARDLPGIETPGALYAALQNLPPEVYEQRDHALEGIRLLPRYAPFEGHIDRWARHIWARHYPPAQWGAIVESVQHHRRAASAAEESA